MRQTPLLLTISFFFSVHGTALDLNLKFLYYILTPQFLVLHWVRSKHMVVNRVMRSINADDESRFFILL